MNTQIKLSELEYLKDINKKIDMAREESIIRQLSDFVSRGLIEIRIKGKEFVRTIDSSGLEYREVVELVLKDKEYIEKLEKENAELKEYKEKITKLLEKGV
jgi:hypothetical protein